MNEHQVENLLGRHGNEIVSRRIVTTPKRRATWRPILITAVAVAAIGTFVLLPRNAEAARIMKIKNAMMHVKSSQGIITARFNGGPWREYCRQTSQGKKQKVEASLGQGGHVTVIFDSVHQWTSFRQLPFATVESTGSSNDLWLKDFAQDPLASAMSVLDGNSNPKAYTLKTTNQPSGTYLIEYTRNDGDPKRGATTIRIFVDQASNLPLESFQTVNYEWGSEEIRTTYRYGIELGPHFFDVDESKKIYDIKSEQQKLAQQWSGVKTKTSLTPIYSSSMTPDGTIWIAYGGPQQIDNQDQLAQVPSQLIAGSTEYRLAVELPTNYESVGKNFAVHGQPAIIAAFVPIEEPAPESSTFRIRFGSRKLRENIELSPESPVQVLSVTKESLMMPEYMIGLGWQKEFLRVGISLWRKKGEAREALGDLKGAIKAYENEIKAYESFVIYASFKPMLKAAACYEKLGNSEKATQLREKAAELQKSRIR